MTDTCLTCQHRVFNEDLGYYVCKIYKHRVKDYCKYSECKLYDRKETTQ